MRAKHARQIRHGVEMALAHHADTRSGRLDKDYIDEIHSRERDQFLTTRLEIRAYWSTRMKHFGWYMPLTRQGVAV